VFTITGGIFIHFGHHVRGHEGPCISLHGHTWKLEVIAAAEKLDAQGFVIDFDVLHARVLEPCHALLDHSLAFGAPTWEETHKSLATLGETLVASRLSHMGNLGKRQPGLEGALCGARNEWPGGIKLAVFPFTPTSERLAQWVYDVAQKEVGDERVRIAAARVYESLHPTELYAEYRPAK
jgi:6-pyruvoyl-tetrahydropterin synthase